RELSDAAPIAHATDPVATGRRPPRGGSFGKGAASEATAYDNSLFSLPESPLLVPPRYCLAHRGKKQEGNRSDGRRASFHHDACVIAAVRRSSGWTVHDLQDSYGLAVGKPTRQRCDRVTGNMPLPCQRHDRSLAVRA